MSKTTVIHHSADFDGLFCREIARKFLPDAELIGWNYGKPKLDFPAEGQVYVLDLSPECFVTNPVFNEDKYESQVARLVWIDHHKSAIGAFPAFIPGYRIDGVAACRLAWQWFGEFDMHTQTPLNKGRQLPNKNRFFDRNVVEPLAVRLAGEYDIWDKRDPNAELFQHGLRSRELTPLVWSVILEENPSIASDQMVLELLNAGEALQYAKINENAAIIGRQGFDLEWEGLKFLACNHAMFNSHLFTAGIKPEHDALFGFRFDGNEFHVSLYHAPGKEHHDLSKLAVKHGGGGHRGACGFRTKTLPFLP
jgi:uncharacterized protein